METADPSENDTAAKPVRLAPGDAGYNAVLDFLNTEAEILDEGRLLEWVDMLSEDLSYRMPIRQTPPLGQGLGFAPTTTFYDDSLTTLRLRIRRLAESPNAHAEVPATRSRRFVTNVQVEAHGDGLHARSSVLVLGSRWDTSTFEFLAARRNDALRYVGNDLKLVSREILIDQTVPEAPCLSVFF